MRNRLPSRLPFFLSAAVAATALVVASLLTVPSAWADDDEYFPPVRNDRVLKECSECHMAFPPSMLPARSWRAVMAGLEDHFGENASLDPESVQYITDYLVAAAADTGGRRKRVLRGLASDEAPLRISETPWWIRQHRGEVRPGAFEDPRVGSKANCAACHRRAERGDYEDD
jgi:hypothetical protein